MHTVFNFFFLSTLYFYTFSTALLHSSFLRRRRLLPLLLLITLTPRAHTHGPPRVVLVSRPSTAQPRGSYYYGDDGCYSPPLVLLLLLPPPLLLLLLLPPSAEHLHKRTYTGAWRRARALVPEQLRQRRRLRPGDDGDGAPGAYYNTAMYTHAHALRNVVTVSCTLSLSRLPSFFSSFSQISSHTSFTSRGLHWRLYAHAHTNALRWSLHRWCIHTLSRTFGALICLPFARRAGVRFYFLGVRCARHRIYTYKLGPLSRGTSQSCTGHTHSHADTQHTALVTSTAARATHVCVCVS